MELKLLFVGDYCPIGRNKNDFDSGEGDAIFGGFEKHTANADFSIANLEAPLIEQGNKIQKSGPNIKASQKSLIPLKRIGFDAVTLANNHILDYDEQGVASTIDACYKYNIKYVGAGKNLNGARKPLVISIKNKKVAILNIAENEFCAATAQSYGANPLHLINNHYDIKKAKAENDYVIVIPHGGREHYQLPSPQLKERYRFFIESGADALISHHTHCFSGYEFYKGKPIFYSLGNFIFDYKPKYQKGLWTQGYGVMLAIDDDKIDFELIPFHQGRQTDPKLQLFDENEKIMFNHKIEELNTIIKDDTLLINAWNQYVKTQQVSYKANLFVQNKYIRALQSKGIFPPIFFHSKKHKVLLENLIRCETHREITLDVLKNK